MNVQWYKYKNLEEREMTDIEVNHVRRIRREVINGYNVTITEVSQDGKKWFPYGEVIRHRHERVSRRSRTH